MKSIAIVYDWLDSWGGAERVLLTLAEMYPDAHWFTSRASERSDNKVVHAIDPGRLHTSFMQAIPEAFSPRKLLAPLYPFAFETFDFTGYDVVVSVTSSYAKGIITKPDTKHLCYMLTPTRFLWIKETDYISKTYQTLLKPYTRYLKRWDYIAGQRPDSIIAISDTVQKRIRNIYKRDSAIIYPPFDDTYWEKLLRHAERPQADIPRGFYMVVSRLVSYKKVELAVQAFNAMSDEFLVVVGSGPQETYLKNIARPNILFLKDISDEQLAWLYSHAHGLIMPQEEDFGYTALEAQMCSCPVIAYKKGGASETVKHKKTGYLFNTQSARGIIDAVSSYEPLAPGMQKYLQIHAADAVSAFKKDIFIRSFSSSVESL